MIQIIIIDDTNTVISEFNVGYWPSTDKLGSLPPKETGDDSLKLMDDVKELLGMKLQITEID